MQIGEGIENALMNIVLEKKTFKRQKSKKTKFHNFLFGNGLTIF
jgi:hypothetical protein